jgi:hypothetical protein
MAARKKVAKATPRGSKARKVSLTRSAPPPPPKLTANELRVLAETADGYRKEDAAIINHPRAGSNERHPYKVVRKKEIPTGASIVIELYTHDDQVPKDPNAREPKLSSDPKVYLEDGTEFDLNKADAIFRSLPALEKFLVGYYARHRNLLDVELMRAAFAKSDQWLMAFHLPTSVEGRAMAKETLFIARPSSSFVDAFELVSIERFISQQ